MQSDVIAVCECASCSFFVLRSSLCLCKDGHHLRISDKTPEKMGFVMGKTIQYGLPASEIRETVIAVSQCEAYRITHATAAAAGCYDFGLPFVGDV